LFRFNHDESELLLKPAQLRIHLLFSGFGLAASAAGTGDWMRLVLPDDFDGMAVVVDWLDALRNRNIELLLEAYAADATLECACEGVNVGGRADIGAYWRPKLASFAPAAFGLEEITPSSDGVMLDYLNFEGKPVRIRFAFNASGEIVHMICEPTQG
jgi:hypothetical protein